jgi:hypothetical protein
LTVSGFRASVRFRVEKTGGGQNYTDGIMLSRAVLLIEKIGNDRKKIGTDGVLAYIR